MSRYPFTDCINEYLPSERGHIANNTLEVLDRRLRQIGRIFHEMKQKGLVSSDNPRYITAKDIDAFVGERKYNGIKSTTILKDLTCLTKLFNFFDNNAVDKFREKFAAHYPKKYQKRGSSFNESLIQEIIDRGNQIPSDQWTSLKSYTLVTLAICSGLRPKELQMLDTENIEIDGNRIVIHAEHVKGEDTYGNERWITVHPDGVPILLRYLDQRRKVLKQYNLRSDALFPSLTHPGYLSYNQIRLLKVNVEDDIGEKFELRKCRRTFGQRAINEGQDIYNISLVMGHNSLATTQKYYCNKEQRQACSEMADFWCKKSKEAE